MHVVLSILYLLFLFFLSLLLNFCLVFFFVKLYHLILVFLSYAFSQTFVANPYNIHFYHSPPYHIVSMYTIHCIFLYIYISIYIASFIYILPVLYIYSCFHVYCRMCMSIPDRNFLLLPSCPPSFVRLFMNNQNQRNTCDNICEIHFYRNFIQSSNLFKTFHE